MRVLPIVAILLFARSTSAQPTAAEPPRASPAEALIRRGLLEPLAAKEDKQSRFSRARLPPRERRVRILDDHGRRDARGESFVRFAVDSRHGFADDEAWTRDDITGCVYLARGDVFIKKGDDYRAAALLLGKYVKAAPASTCRDRTDVARGD